MKSFFKALYRRKWRYIFLALIVLFIVFSMKGGSAKLADEFVTITRGTVKEVVSATGQIRPEHYATLRFESAGTIADMAVDTGDKVYKGQYLARLNAGELSQRVVQAQAELKAAEVALTNASQSISDTEVKNNQSLKTAYAEALAGLTDIYSLAQKTHASFGFFYDASGRLTDTITANLFDSAALNAANNARGVEEKAFAILKTKLEALSEKSTATDIDMALSASWQPLADMQRSVITLFVAIDKLQAGSISASTIDGYRTTVTTAQNNINTAVTKQSGYARAIADAKVNNGLSANTSSASYRTAQANVETAKAGLSVARANLANAYLYAPMSGVIATKSKHIGESVSATDQVYYILGEGDLEVTANISEVDIAKIAVGNTATVTLDAYGSEQVFEVAITKIDPAETIIDGIATYKTTFTFTVKDERIRSGMTANIVVATQTRENVLIVPQRAIQTKEGKRVVLKKTGEETSEEIVITTGLRGMGGDVEVIAGLSEGEVVIIRPL